MRPSIADRLSEFAVGLRLSDVPAPLLRKVKLHVLDTIGVALASSTFEFSRLAVNSLSAFGGGHGTVIGFAEQLSARDAALANGIMIHGLDYDDASIEGRVHPSSACLSAVLAVAEMEQQSGTELLLGYLVGVECEIRLGAVAKGAFQRRGFHPTGVVGAFGATMAAGRLLKLSPAMLSMAQGIALSTAAGSQEFSTEGAWTKRMHPGWAAAGGITAGVLASGGFTGPSRPYDGTFGLFPLYLGDAVPRGDIGLAVEDLGSKWLVETLAAKPLPACYFNVPVIEAAIRIARDNDIEAGDIAKVEVLVPQAAVQLVCEPVEAKRRPVDCYAAQFSVYFCAAAGLARRRFALDDLQNATLNDPEIRSLMDRTTYALDLSTTFPRYYPAAIRVRTHDGRIFEAREDVHWGSAERPLSEAELVGKFTENARKVFPGDHVGRLREMVENIEEVDDARKLTALLRPSCPASGKVV